MKKSKQPRKTLRKSVRTIRKKSTRSIGYKTYQVHDNGGRPFLVQVNTKLKKLCVFNQDYDDDTDKWKKGEKILETRYNKIFIGDNNLNDNHYAPKGKNSKGNSILVKLDDSYLFIGHTIYSFNVDKYDEIVEYYSPIGNSDVPYPYAIGKYRTYFMLDKKSLPNGVLDLDKDGYSQYYGFNKNQKKLIENNFTRVIE